MDFGVTWIEPVLAAGAPASPSEPPLWPAVVFCAFWFTVLGTIFGSFLNVVIYRLPRGLNLAHPPSHCPRCKAPIRARDNVPVVGWLLLGGRCRDCRTPISARYPAVEAVCGIVMLLVYLAFDGKGSWTESLVYGRFDAAFWNRTLVMVQGTVVFLTILAAALIAYDGCSVPIRLWHPAAFLTATSIVVACFMMQSQPPGIVTIFTDRFPLAKHLTGAALDPWSLLVPAVLGALLWTIVACVGEGNAPKPVPAAMIGAVAGGTFGVLPVVAAGATAVATHLVRLRLATANPNLQTPSPERTKPPTRSTLAETPPPSKEVDSTPNPRTDIARALPMVYLLICGLVSIAAIAFGG